MKRCSLEFLVVVFLCFLMNLAIHQSASAETVTLQTLLQEMVNRDVLARVPSPAYTCRQASSYDRDSVSPDDPTTWFANWDRSQFIRSEEKDGRQEHVLLDADGPGAIVRFWATWHGPGGGQFSNGTLRVYLDHAKEPAIEGPIAEMIDGGKLTGPPLSEGVSPKTPYRQRGHNLYLPIPYSKHCKITYSTEVLIDRGGKKGEALYYQINYRTYEEGTEVESFSMDRLKAAEPVLEKIQETLTDCELPSDKLSEIIEGGGSLAPGDATEPIQIQGPAAIRRLRLQLKADDLEQALRSTILEIRCDGEQTVWCPVGEFVGTGYKIRPYKSWYTQVAEDGTLACGWVMPFEKEASLQLHNLSSQGIDITLGEIGYGDWDWDPRSMHFHATWKQLTKVDAVGHQGQSGHGAIDVNYVTVQGQGLYVGDTLTVVNGAASWWGEGDEKIFVDGEKFPSHFGTGTEDYYGYAWCRPEFFQSPFHAQPEGGGNLEGGFSVNSRYRALDAIPFQQSIQFDMELWHWANTKISYAPATFWYARPGATWNVKPDPATAALEVAKTKEDLASP
ncbi:MAG: DUF2961 domain-containing protein [Pirellulales bacterium]|nr:DUF2961 domain-containing protein [Pirellulales bacterium]